MGAGDLPVDGTGVGAVLLALGTVDEGDALAQVPLGLGGGVDALQLDDAGLGGLQVLTTLVAQVAGLNVQTKEEGEKRFRSG